MLCDVAQVRGANLVPKEPMDNKESVLLLLLLLQLQASTIVPLSINLLNSSGFSITGLYIASESLDFTLLSAVK